ncbi:hypothetical protein E2562_023665 [Oryza meyeriana var. granulata]|uniref:Uncharacterized protein n=1 Tax=Oryza meyeriana var. granulata TaxID=110450 RepID=A0A6G1BLZ6_9ORYZ|nr:hypothetical protein E2562_023665 [Oryza meyeriana var. granulata]
MASSFPAALMEQINDARHSVARLRTALISVGVVLLEAAVALMFKALGGILLRLHGRAAALVYYGVLGAVAVYGAAEASVGYWVVPRDMVGNWRATIGKTVLWISVLLLALVASLGSLAFLKY